MRVETGKYRDVNFTQAIYVDMDHYARSSSQPIMTTGAGPCITILVNNPITREGALSHVWDIKVSQQECYAKALKTLKALQSLVGALKGDEIYLFAGKSFKVGATLKTQGLEAKDFSEYAQDRIGRDHKIYDYTSSTMQASPDQRKDEIKGHNTPDVIYIPRDQQIYVLGDGDGRVMRANSTQEGAFALRKLGID